MIFKPSFISHALLLLLAANCNADLTLPKILSDGMVLQRDRHIPLWGKATPGERITVNFAERQAVTIADPDGNWQVQIDTGPASNKPAELTITAANSITIKNILVGDVWICSGQSNMEYPLNRRFLNGTPPPPADVPDLASTEYAKANLPDIRILRVERNLNSPDLPTDGWHPCTGAPLEHFSAIAYFFGKELNQELKVPIGLIQTAWAGSRIEPWTPPDAYAGVPALKEDAAKSSGQLDGSPVGNYYRKLVAPVAPFAARGVLWYQGESNIITTNDGLRYRDKFQALVAGWRNAWQDPNLPFLQVQLAPYAYSRRNDPAPHPDTALPELWEAQQAAIQIPHVGLAPILDLADDPANIHPWNKWEVGHRLALWALANSYGHMDIIFSGPLYKSMEVRDGKIWITFDHARSGLAARDGKPLTEFTIAGPDGKFLPATATLDGTRVIVSSPDVPAPKAVRFAWNELPHANLINKEGLPAFPFRTDGPLTPR